MLSPTERLRVLSRLFTRPTIASLSTTGDWRRSCGFLERHGLVRPSRRRPLSEIFQAAWLEMHRWYRTEYVYKNEIANRIVFGRHKPSTVTMQLEMPVGRSIVDVAVFNGTSTAYEIKTEFDSARRLQTQTSDYVKAFENVYIVTHPDFAEAYANLVPPNIGVLVLTTSGSLCTRRSASSCLDYLDMDTIFRCLHREEYLSILSGRSPHLRTLPNGVVGEKSRQFFAGLPTHEAHRMYVESVRRRKATKEFAAFAYELPDSLRALGCAIPLSKPQQKKLLSTLRENVSFTIA